MFVFRKLVVHVVDHASYTEHRTPDSESLKMGTFDDSVRLLSFLFSGLAKVSGPPARHPNAAVAAMRGLPWEITDAIIDQFAPSESKRRTILSPFDRREADILRVCALTCRAFTPRSQRHLFSSIGYDQVPGPKLEGLVSGSPHLIASYVTHFNVVLTWTIDSNTLISRILGLAENLTHLGLYCAHNSTMRTPTPLFPEFGCYAVTDCTFADVLEIESLVSHASNLKELDLGVLNHDDMSVRHGDPVSHEERVVLDSLTLTIHGTADHVVDAMLSSFRVLDIRHL
ncbi:hypothetical protein C8J57DRAFT_1222565 [Mycena rebaudengoi]|nr:hypothetical protein C8J57DRAFT_1222565 [Mycena rebaudengoi]